MEEIKLYHYTSISHLIEIFRTGKLKLSQTDKMLKVKKPGLWFSTNSEWEFSAFKRFNDGKKEFDLNKPDEFEKYIGCARLITKLDSRFVTYAKYKYKSKAHPLVWEKIGEVGRSKGANPEEWYATFSPINVDNLDIEVYDNGSWYNLKKEDGEFDTELFNKNLEKTFIYKRGKELESKMEKQPIETKEEVPVVEQVKEEEPVVEEVKEEVPVVEQVEEEVPVVEEVKEEEPVVEQVEEEVPVVEEVKEEEPVVEEVKEEVPVVEEVKEEEPVVEQVEEQEPVLDEIKDEKPVEEELKPEGFMSKVRGFFGRFKKKK